VLLDVREHELGEGVHSLLSGAKLGLIISMVDHGIEGMIEYIILLHAMLTKVVLL
jgi:hypothetical protein